jgi:hypothetical protein
MLLPLMWLRKKKLDRLLKDYPLYDPPHKVEERLLPKEKAQENFEYLMRVRKERVAFFSRWLEENFGVKFTSDRKGAMALGGWLIRYGGLLFPTETVYRSYFSYDPPWTSDGTGCNVVFDAGVTFGESIIANCARLRWEMGPASPAFTEKDIKELKRDFGSGFQRPEITGFIDLLIAVDPLSDIEYCAAQMRKGITYEGRKRYFGELGLSIRKIERYPALRFDVVLDAYNNGSLRMRYLRDHGIDIAALPDEQGERMTTIDISK